MTTNLTTLESRILDAMRCEDSAINGEWTAVGESDDDQKWRLDSGSDAANWARDSGLTAHWSDDEIIRAILALADRGIVTARWSRSGSSQWYSLSPEGRALAESAE